MHMMSRIGRRSATQALKTRTGADKLPSNLLRDLGYAECRIHTARPTRDWTLNGPF